MGNYFLDRQYHVMMNPDVLDHNNMFIPEYLPKSDYSTVTSISLSTNIFFQIYIHVDNKNPKIGL